MGTKKPAKKPVVKKPSVDEQLDHELMDDLDKWMDDINAGGAWPYKKIPAVEFKELVRLGRAFLAQYERICKL